MVCNRCKTTVKTELDKLGISFVSVELGEVVVKKKLTPVQHHLLFLALEQFGFELIKNEKNKVIEKLKKAIYNLEMYSDEELKTSCSDFISGRVNDNYISLNTLFSETGTRRIMGLIDTVDNP